VETENVSVTQNHVTLSSGCEICGKSLEGKRKGTRTCGDNCRKQLSRLEERVHSQIVLSLFPGADLLGRAFEAAGFCVVRGPDVLWGGDIHEFHVPPGKFDGVIGGPPCQVFSPASRMNGTDAVNLIPEYLRIVAEAKPRWAVMENVVEAVVAAPSWPYTVIEDYNCGGHTGRERAFWFYGLPPPVEPPYRSGRREHTVLARSWTMSSKAKREGHKRAFGGSSDLKADEAARLQGFPELANNLMEAWPLRSSNFGMNAHSKNVLAVHLLGNGVPQAMGKYIAEHVKRQVQKRDNWEVTDMPPYPLFLLANG
jgi:DNA (cytosine-5)-methyltransferase 1